MKSIIITFILCICTSMAFSQTSEIVEVTDQTIPPQTTNIDKTNLNHKHTQAALEIIQNHIAQHIKYPEEMVAYGKEGTIVIEVSIDSDGTIEDIKVVKSFSSFFDNIVLKEMASLEALNQIGGTYEGKRTIFLPVKFSLK